LQSVSIAARFAQTLRVYVVVPAPRLPEGPYTLSCAKHASPTHQQSSLSFVCAQTRSGVL
jgi:hypothetical protein